MSERTLRDQIASLPRYRKVSGEPGFQDMMMVRPDGGWLSRAEVLAILDAQPAPDAVAEVPTDGQLVSACLSYDHSYGLMTPEQRDDLHFQCREWWRSIARAINDGDRT